MNASENGKKDDNERSSREINDAINDLLQRSSRIKLSGLNGQDNIAIGLKGDSEIDINGNVGRYLGSFNSGPVIVLKGDCGDLAADNLMGGGLIIMGNCGDRCGVSMTGGIIVIKGNSGTGIANSNHNGTIIVDGMVKGDAGEGMDGGKVIITGDVKGTLGKGSTRGFFYIAGNVNELGEELHPADMERKDFERLKKYFDHYGIDVFPKGFRKYFAGKVK